MCTWYEHSRSPRGTFLASLRHDGIVKCMQHRSQTPSCHSRKLKPATRPRSWRRPAHRPLCQAHPPAPKERGVGGPRRHAERPTGAAAIRAAVRLVASHDHACTRTNPSSCRSSSSVPILRSMWESCDNGTRAKKAMGNVPPSCCVAPSGRCGDRSQTLSGQLSHHKQHPPHPSGVLCSDKHHVWAVTVAVTIPDKPPCILRERFYSGKTSV